MEHFKTENTRNVFKETNIRQLAEENRTFSVCPKLFFSSGEISRAENDTWMELSQFIIEDLRWLLSLDDIQFSAYLFHSDEVARLILSILRESIPVHFRSLFQIDNDIESALKEIEHLVFLVFVRLASQKAFTQLELKQATITSSLLSVPVLMDFCLYFGENNSKTVKQLLAKISQFHPTKFHTDLESIILNFITVLKSSTSELLRGDMQKFSEEVAVVHPKVTESIFFLHDAVATLQIFLTLYPKGCYVFADNYYIFDVILFYLDVLPKLEKNYSPVSDFIHKIRIDLLKIALEFFHWLSAQVNEQAGIGEFLDYCLNVVSSQRLRHFLEDCDKLDPSLQLITAWDRHPTEKNHPNDPGPEQTTLMNLVAEIHKVLPEADTSTVLDCLKRHDCDLERTVAALLDSSEGEVALPERNASPVTPRETQKGKSTWLGDAEPIDKSMYARWFLVADDAYDDEYDDTYDGGDHVDVREGEDVYKDRRPIVVPRALRASGEEEEGEEEEEDGGSVEDENEEEIREVEENRRYRRDGTRGEFGNRGRDVVGRGRGRGQSHNVSRNRNLKEVHKSHVGNHDRKRQADRKRNRGMIPS